MKIILPENQNEITLAQYQRYIKLCDRTDLDAYNFNRRVIEIFTSLSFKDTERIAAIEFEEIVAQINKALNEEVKFSNTFVMNRQEFGFIPNLDKMTTAEFVDLEKYTDNVETLNYLMAILFRPIINKDVFKNYTIAEYNGTEEWAEYMKQTPLNIVNGALFFFMNLSTELENHILKYMKEEQKRVRLQATTF